MGVGARAAESARRPCKHAVLGRGVAISCCPTRRKWRRASRERERRTAGSCGSGGAVGGGVGAGRRRAARRATARDHRGSRRARGIAPRSWPWRSGSAPRSSPPSRRRAWWRRPPARRRRARPERTPVASWVMNEADALLVFGASFPTTPASTAGHPIVQVDDDPASGSASGTRSPRRCRRRRRHVPRCCDRAPGRGPRGPGGRHRERWALWRAEKASRRATTAAAAWLARRCSPRCRGRAGRCRAGVDVGNHAYSFGRYFEWRRSGRADERLPRLDRLRPAGGAGRRRRTGPGRPIVVSAATAGSASTWS